MSEAVRIERTAAPLRQQVVRLIREDILNGALAPGQRLVESSLCTAYGVSRTVVREALRQLESENLIRVLPAQGPIVAVLSEPEIRALYVVRGQLEGLAGRLFAESAGPAEVRALVALRERLRTDYIGGTVARREDFKRDFYGALIAGAGNAVLGEMLAGIHARIAIFRRFAFVDEERVALSAAELDRIIDAAAVRRDPAAAEAACVQHIRVAAELALVEYERRTPGFRRG
jgi:DNA-binding GntR family transcriptional regulator